MDAFRHCVTSCMLTNEYNGAIAEIFGEFNENKGDLGGQRVCERAMDEHNNEVGRELAERADNDEACAAECLGALANGELDTINVLFPENDGRY